uniref:Uncharacterized protein n=1 Tax=Solanum tuberosum TaxID=4113 RepID=M1ATR1_SOLTU
MKAKESENREKPSQKYIQVITEDDFEFWFMGFLNHQKNSEISAPRNFKYFKQLRRQHIFHSFFFSFLRAFINVKC